LAKILQKIAFRAEIVPLADWRLVSPILIRFEKCVIYCVCNYLSRGTRCCL